MRKTQIKGEKKQRDRESEKERKQNKTVTFSIDFKSEHSSISQFKFNGQNHYSERIYYKKKTFFLYT